MSGKELASVIKSRALKLGFSDVGITSVESLHNLPHGWVADVKELKYPQELLRDAKSVIMLVLHAWDKSFFMQIESPFWRGYGLHTPAEPVEGFYVIHQISQTKALPLVTYLRDNGYDALMTSSIPMKSTAIACGLGSRGKNTLLIHPVMGPRLGLLAIITNAELDSNVTLVKDQCGDCDRCVKACPAHALSEKGVEINRCIAYASETPAGTSVPEDVRGLVDRFTVRPSKCSYLECTVCMDACPIGRDVKGIMSSIKRLNT